MIEILRDQAFDELADLPLFLSSDSFFVVSGKNSFESSGAQERLSKLATGKGLRFFSDFSVNPKLEDVLKGIQAFRSHPCQSIIAVGGGSAIDMAKLIRSASEAPDSEVPSILQGSSPIPKRLVPLIAVPTTAGAGSEATQFAVIYVNGIKGSLDDPKLLPTVAIIDSTLTHSLPSHVTASSGFDAISQAIESYWSVKSNPESREYSRQAIELVLGSIPRAVNSPDPDSRRAMMYAAHLAGKAIQITRTTAPHALSYTLTSRYGIPHGHAVALMLARFFTVHELVESDQLNGGLEFASFCQRRSELHRLMQCDNAQSCQDRWFFLMRDVGLGTDLKALGVAESDFASIAEGVNLQRLQNHPVRLNKKGLLSALTAG